jgi:hypothetical protein
MSIIERLLAKFKKTPPVILSPWGPVSESARKQAVFNLRLDSTRRVEVLRRIIVECKGDRVRGLVEAQRRYPEARFSSEDYR